MTAAAVGNSAATSGAKRTRFVPCAKRFEYFPRTPAEKSYSRRMCAARGVRFRDLMVFFICIPFLTAGDPGANNANGGAPLDVSDNYKMLSVGPADQDEPLLIAGVIGIRNRDRERIAEGRGCFRKTDSMFA